MSYVTKMSMAFSGPGKVISWKLLDKEISGRVLALRGSGGQVTNKSFLGLGVGVFGLRHVLGPADRSGAEQASESTCRYS